MAEKTPLFGAGLFSKSEHLNAQHRLNVYAEVQHIEDKTRISFHGTPGLVLFADTGTQPIRGMVVTETTLYAVNGTTLYSIDNTPTITSIGTLNTSTGRVDMAWTGTHVVMVDGTNGYTYNPTTLTFAQITSGDFPNGATTVTWHDGYTIVENGTEFAISALDDPTTWSAIDRAAAESSADDLVRVFADRGYISLFGRLTTELWGNTGSADFPYQRIGGGVIERGLAAKWSVTKFRDGIAGLFQNSEGDVEVGLIAGGSYQKISSPEIDYTINNYSNPNNATGLAYRHSGHSFYQINFGTDDKSWIFDADSTLWSQVSTDDHRHIGEQAVSFINRTLLASAETGKLYRLAVDVYSDDGAVLKREITSRHLYEEDYFSISSLWVDTEGGTGLTLGQGVNPVVMLRISKDGGKTFPTEIFGNPGEIGEYQQRLHYRRLGRSRNWVFKLRCTDPIKFVVFGEGWVR